MRYFIELSYNGANYKGWQRQRNAPSVQQTLEESLSRLLGGPVEVTGAGRTDTGVHAAYYVAHFDVSEAQAIADESDFIYHANSILPPDVALRSVRRVADDAHARFDAVEREYTYYILPRKDPFLCGVAWQYTVPLDVDAMNDAAAKLLTTSDFTTFAKLGGGNKTNICRVITAHWRVQSSKIPLLDKEGWRPQAYGVVDVDSILVFTIRADRFLRNMVRAIVGTLVDVGRGKMTPAQFAAAVDARDLSLSSAGAPAQGLFLTDVKYL
jgi:tRNA pseudouridine38-40 synthase